jgi:hypothetical protein
MKLNKSLDSIALGGKTYREIFVDGQLVLNGIFDNNSTTGYVLNALHTVVDNKLQIDKSAFALSRYNTLLSQNSVYYVNALMSNNGVGAKGVNVIIGNIDVSYIAGTLNPNNTTTLTLYSNVITTNSTANLYLSFGRGDTAGGIGYIDNINLLNLTALFGAGNEPTKAQMDTLFAEFQEAGSVSVGQFEQAVLTDRFLSVHTPASNDIPIPALNNKTLNEVFDRSILTNITALPNGVKYYEVSGGNIVQRVEEHIFNGLESWDSFVIATNTYQPRLLTGNIGNTLDGTRYFGVLENTIFDFNTSLDDNEHVRLLNTSALRVHIEKSKIDVMVSGGTIAGWKEYLSLNNFQILYQLATPITIVSGVSITQQDLDNYYQAWQRNNAGTLLANTFIQHDQNSVPIADLNGKTLDEVFIGGNLVVNGDFSENINGWNWVGSNSIWENGRLKNTGNGTSIIPYITQNINYFNGNVYYNRFDYEIFSPVVSLVNRISSPTQDIIFSNNPSSFQGFLSAKDTATSDKTTFLIWHRYNTNADALNKVMYYDNIVSVNLTVLGITATKEQLDFWYSVWQQNHKLGMRVHRASGNDIPLAVLNNQSLNQVFDRSILTDITALPNGVKYYEVSGGNIVQRVEEYVLQASDFTTLYTVNTNSDTVSVPRNTIPLSVNFTSGIDNTYIVDRFGSDILASDFNGDATGIVGRTYFNNSFLNFIVAKGTYANLAAAQADLAGTQVLYQLATPITIVSGVSITQSQLDYLYQVWQFNQVNALVARQFIQEA